MTRAFETCDVFTTTRFGGNPLAVVFEAAGLDGVAMQAIAREFNLSETVFVTAGDAAAATAAIRIFTPGMELPFAGHPNVGAAVLLARRLGIAGDAMALDQKAGRVIAALRRDASGLVTGATITAPVAFTQGDALDGAAMAACVGLSEPLQDATIASCGTPFALAEVADAAMLAAAAPDEAAFRRHLPTSRAIGLNLFCRIAPGRLRTRMFAPLVGVVEDPATGAANVALAGLLLARDGGARLSLDVEQGMEMGRPSLLRLSAWRDAMGIRVSVGGEVVPFSAGRLLA